VKRYLVDTNIPSELTRDRTETRVAAFLASAGQSRVFLSVLTIGEICKGIAELPASQKHTELQDWLDIEVRSCFAGRILPVTEAISEQWGNLSAAAKQKGMTLAVVDGMIAATALHHGLTIVTRNVKDFAGLGADVFNPWKEKFPA
jgi:predicted nucleic acid-binding protein